MKQLYLFFMLVIFFITGCQAKSISISKDEKRQLQTSTISEDPTTPATTNLPTTQASNVLPTVSNSGGAFSNNDLIYFIMIDRFYDGDSTNNSFSDVNKNDLKKFHGGDLKGITKKLDYIQSLGATTIWLTPVIKNEPYGYHGYWTYDFYDIDPHFGSMDDLKELVDKAHKKGIKVLLDHIVNHTGYQHPWLQQEDKKDWFHPKLEITNWNNQEQVENGWLAGLPDLNQSNPEVRKYLIDNTLWWIEQTGVDGMRLDTMRHVPKDFWNELAKEVKHKYPNFYLLGEVWNNNPRYLELYHQVGIDGMTNYSLYEGIVGTFHEFGSIRALVNSINKEKNFSAPHLNGIFIDNHDNRRLITVAGENGEQYVKQALTFIMTYPAIPIIYYGTEIGMEGENDPDNRRFMEWEKTKESTMLEFYQTLVQLRQNNKAIQSGEFELLGYDDQFISYILKTDETAVVVIINIKNKEKEVQIDINHSVTAFHNILNKQLYDVSDNQLNIKLQPLELLILESQKSN